ncbi:MAG: hypothetical protein A2036_01320 [Omnitrophica bacterium GWA2_50_21]|nr:MAG: hypothetical protein A2036_01320 [Omnitrophica bacterium GWA2_50_21]
MMPVGHNGIAGFLKARLFYEQWILAVARHDSKTDFFPAPEDVKIIEPPSGYSWADPFLVNEKGRKYIFFEEYNFLNPKGAIRVAELSDSSTLVNSPTTVLDEPFHVSYPCIFKWNDRYYMIPETMARHQIRLYRADLFPHKWTLEKILVEDIFAADPSVLNFGGLWWLFASIRKNSAQINNETVDLFYSETPLGPWKIHAKSPIKKDIFSSRPAGRPFEREGAWYRPAQDCSRRYGFAISINRIDIVNPKEYKETLISRIYPNWKKGLLATHTLNQNGNLSVFDGLRRSFKYPIRHIRNFPASAKGMERKIAFYAIGSNITPSTRFRVLPYVTFLKNKGWRVDAYLLPNLIDTKILGFLKLFWIAIVRYFQLLKANQYDVVVVQKGLTPWRSKWILNNFFAKKLHYIYDFDDAIYHEPPIVLPRAFDKLQELQAPDLLMKNASCVIAGNEYLVQYAQKINNRCRILPTPIDTSEYFPFHCHENDRLIIGWTGTAGTNCYVNRILPIIDELSMKHKLCFLLMSEDLRDVYVPKRRHFEFQFVKWDPETSVSNLQQVSIGIMPLPDDEWGKGKCSFKAIQFMALGTPVVVTPIGMNRELVRHGENGFWAETDKDWLDTLEILIGNEPLRKKMGTAARQTILDKYSVHQCGPIFEAFCMDRC